MSAAPKTKILFDAHPLIGQKTGVGWYTYLLVEALASEYKDEVVLYGYYHNFLGRKKIRDSLPSAENIRYIQVQHIPGQIVNAANRMGLRVPIELLTLKRADFILYPNFWGQPSLFKTPLANVIHDLTYVDVPQYVSNKNARDLVRNVPKTLKEASFAITVSEFSKRRIHEVYDFPVEKIVRTYIPTNKPLIPSAGTITKVLNKNKLSNKKFILFLGTLEPRKNLENLLDAYCTLPESIRNEYALVLAGKTDWKYENILQKIEALQAEHVDIRYLGYIDDETRAVLYSQTSCFVFPSVYEGFGMPIIEALYYGVSVCASNIDVLREVAGGAIRYFEPLDPESISTTIRDILSNKSISEAVPPSIKNSWSSMAREIFARIKAVIQ
jgi:glycosyltransferase involved in cell wall biosynthesis